MTGMTPLPGNWAERAACRGWPTKWWYPLGEERESARTPAEKAEDAAVARRICLSCPVAAECDTHATRFHELGIWAALDEKDRRGLISRYQRRPQALRRPDRRAS